jgi:hypothetical protein
MPTTKETLSNAITAALHRQRRSSLIEFLKPSGARSLTRAGLAAAMLQAPTAGAITLGALEHDSAIGDPFRATAAVTIAAGEALQPGCITTSPYKLGTLRLRDPIQIKTPRAQRPGLYTIELTTNKPLTEPMYEVQLRVACPGTAALTRSYIVMVDAPRGFGNIEADTGQVAAAQAPVQIPAPQPVMAQPQPASIPTLTTPVAGQRPAEAPPAAKPAVAADRRPLARRTGVKSVNPGQRYTVVRGDTLFGIAARLNERPAGATWAAARMLYEANPTAFVNGDKSKLKLGAILTVPGAAIVANLKPETEFLTPTNPGAPGPERALPARPAMVRSEDAMRVETEQNRAAADADSTAEPVPFALKAAALAPVSEATAKPVDTETELSTAPELAAPVAPTPADQAAPRAEPQSTVSYPATEPVSPLLAGLIGMLLGALFATLLFSARRIVDSLRRNEWNEAEATQQFDTFTATDTLDAYEHVAPVGQPFDEAEDSQHIELSETADDSLQLPRMETDEFPAEPSPFGTIEVEFSELDALARKTLGFDLSEALGQTTEQPQLGESPRINLEGLGSNFDLNRELEEMLEEFGPQRQEEDTVDVDLSELREDHEDTDVDIDLEEDAEITHPRLAEETGADAIFNASQTSLSEATDLEDEANKTLAIKSFALGLDLDLHLNGQEDANEELDFSFDAESLRDESDSED